MERRARFLGTVLVTAAIALCAGASSASASISLSTFSISGSTMQAGAHPNVTVNLAFSGDTPKDLTVSLPPGLLGNPQSAPKCTLAELDGDNCPSNTQVGTTSVNATAILTINASGSVYLLQPQGNEPVDLGIVVRPGIANNIYIAAPIDLRPTDAGLNTVITNLPNSASGIPLIGTASMTINSMSLVLDGVLSGGAAFMTNPTTCASETASASTTGWSGGSDSATASYQSTGCASVPFAPTLTTTATPSERDTPTALTVALGLPNPGNGNAQSAFQNVSMTLPPGLVMNSGVADGSLSACSDAQLAQGSGNAPTCPAASQIGTATINTPLLPTINGTVYLGTQTVSGQYRIFVDLPAPGTHIELIGIVTPNASTGQVTAVFSNLPQIPLTGFTLAFNGGTQAVFDAPTACGTLTGSSALTPYSGNANATPSPSVSISNDGAGQACPSPIPFAPTFSATPSSTQAGASTNLTLTISRADRSDRLATMALTLPPGLDASILNLPTCSSTNLNANTCPSDTQLGTVSALVGSGSSTLTLNGGIYLAAGTGSAPADLAIVLPAVVGPFNLGSVVTLAPITVDPVTGALGETATLPSIVQGIPINLRQLQLTLNAANFLTNSTSCAVSNFTAAFTSVGNQTATDTVPYQATGCGSVPYTPTVATNLSTTARDSAAAVTVNLTDPGTGQSTTKNVSIVLPPGLALNPSVASSGNLQACSDAQWGAGNGNAPTCPASSSIGTATFTSTLMPAISGTVYIGSASGPNPFRVFVDLPVAGVDVKLIGLVTLNTTAGADYGQLTTTFSNLPQIPFTSFSLAFNGGAQGVFDTPTTCGSFTGSADLAPWSGNADYTSSSTPAISISDDGLGGACASHPAFAPTLTTSLSTTQAAAGANLTITINRPDRNDRPTALSLELPAGLDASILGVPQCSSTNVNANTCPSNTQLGTVSAQVGSGAGTATLSGNVYLTAGTGSAPGALAIILPAVVGPFNFGTTVTTANIGVDPSNGAITQIATLPTQVGGIPFSLRQLQLVLNRANFVTNAATCSAEQFTGTMTAAGGETAALSSNYQATGCGSVAFTPSVSTSVSPSARDTPTALTVTVTTPGTGSTVKNAAITLPPGLVVSPGIASGGNLQACSDAQFNTTPNTCPAASQIGTATFNSTLLAPISGTVYVGTASGGSPFRVFVDLPVAGVDVKLIGTVSLNANTGQVTTTFTNLPQIPFTSFVLSFQGGTNAVFDNPTTCGTSTGSIDLTPWDGNADFTSSSQPTVSISNDGSGGACPNPPPFAPSFAANVSSATAGGYTNLTMTLTRSDRDSRPNQMNVSLPPGLDASILGVPQCASGNVTANTCANNTQLGTVSATVGSGANTIQLSGGIYLTAGTANAPADLAIILPAIVGPFNLGNSVTLAPITVDPVTGAIGVSASLPLVVGGVPVSLRQLQLVLNRANWLTNATTCSAETFSGTVTSVDNESVPLSANYQATGCGSLPYAPSLTTAYTSTARDTPTGVTVTVNSPGNGQSATKNVSVVLPPGLAVNPGIASGGNLADCTVAQWNSSGSGAAPNCPAASQIGTATFTSTLLSPITGTVYLGAASGQSPFQVFVDLPVTAGGTHVKLTGTVSLDANTGQVTTAFTNLPQIPFTSFQLVFQGGSQAVFDTPTACGTVSTSATLTPWSGGANVTSSPSVSISNDGSGAACPNPPPFTPTLSTSLSTLQAGANANLTVTINRNDRDDRPNALALTLPAGLVASIGNVPQCSSTNVQANNCDPSTQLGTVTATVGSGTSTIQLTGGVYLTAGTGNAPADLAIILPAVVGPFNFGNSVTLAPISIDPVTGAISENATLPTIIGGVPFSLRQLQLVFNRANFITNATNCTAEQFTGTLSSVGAQSQPLSSNYQATGCGSVPFTPSVTTTLGSSARDTATSLTVNVTSAGLGQATVKNVSVTLPQGLVVDPSVASSGTLQDCTDAQLGPNDGSAANCPAASQIGTATLTTPLLSLPAGKIFIGSPSGASPFRVFVVLPVTASGTQVKLVGTVALDANTGRVTTAFSSLPQIPFTSFQLAFQGGAQAVFDTPTSCGTLSGVATLTPWSGGSNATPTPSITISNDGAGAACPNPLPFTPTLSSQLSTTQAGATTNLTLTVNRNDRDDRPNALTLNLPPGLVASLVDNTGNPLPTCADQATLQAGGCPSNSQVGTVTASVGSGSGPLSLSGSVYLMPGTGNAVADLGILLPAVVGPFNFGNAVSVAQITINPQNAAISATASLPTIIGGIPVSLRQFKLTLDGTVDNGQRFMQNATSCGANSITGSMTSVNSQTANNLASGYQATACASEPFSPSVSTTFSTPARDTPGQMTVGVTFPAAGQSAVSAVSVTLPQGVAVNPGVASGGNLGVCTDQEWNSASGTAPTCPGSSQIGTATFGSTVLAPISGTVYLGSPTAQNLIRVFVDLPIAGVNVKLTGLGTLDPSNGQVTTAFSGLPAIPFTSFVLTFQGGSNAVFDTPTACGTSGGSATLTPSSLAPAVTVPTSVTISDDGNGAPCPSPLPFSPGLSATVTGTQAAGNPSSVALTITRNDRDGVPTGLSLKLPPGLVASLNDIHGNALPTCTVPEAQADNCPMNTLLGEASAVVGSGASTVAIGGGSIYLADGNGSSLASLAIILPAVVGPFNLGTSVTFAQVTFDPSTGRIVTTAALPTIIGGVPISLRSLTLTLDQNPTFFINATSCAASQFDGTMTSSDGATADLTAPYQATGCDNVPFSPHLTLTPSSTARDTPAGLAADIDMTTPAGQSTLQALKLKLPTGFAVNPGIGATITDPCQGDDVTNGTCPADSQIGTAQFTTPLLPQINGSVYLAKGSGSTPFRVVVELPVSGSTVVLVGDVTIDHDPTSPTYTQVTTTFSNLPQIPFTDFKLNFTQPLFDTPTSCGTFTGEADMTPWDGAAGSTTNPSFSISGSCPNPPPFSPTVTAAVSNTTAGAPTTLGVTMTANDQDSRPAQLAFTLPPGLSATLNGIPECAAADAPSGNCDASTQVGEVSATVGSGSSTATLSGQVFLAQPTAAGAAASLVIYLPASVGKFSLGDPSVTVAPITVAGDGTISTSAALPQSVDGVSFSLRSLTLTLDRPGFVTNATGCSAESFSATVSSVNGQSAGSTPPYEATGCAALAFKPSIDASIGRDTKDNGASFQTVVTLPAGSANLATASIGLPNSLSVRAADVTIACGAPSASQCPASADVGTATALSPLLPTALSGPVVLMKTSGGFGLGIPLGGAISLPLSASVDLGSLTTSLTAIPDLPVSRFELDLSGGPASMLIPVATACDKPGVLTATFTAHNGAQSSAKTYPTIKPCSGDTGNGSGTINSMQVRLADNTSAMHQVLKATVKGKGIKIMRFSVPKGLTLVAHKKGLRVKVDGKMLAAKYVKVSPHSLLIKLPKGANTIAISIQPPTLQLSSTLAKKHKKSKLKFQAKTHTTSGSSGTLTTNVKA
jgi:hypothetical protein